MNPENFIKDIFKKYPWLLYALIAGVIVWYITK